MQILPNNGEDKMSGKHTFVPVAKPGQLLVKWGRPERNDNPAICYAHGGKGSSRPDARMISNFFEEIENFDGKNLRQELVIRGYDLETLKFSIKMKAPDKTPDTTPDETPDKTQDPDAKTNQPDQ
jgi:hypothetical protein